MTKLLVQTSPSVKEWNGKKKNKKHLLYETNYCKQKIDSAYHDAVHKLVLIITKNVLSEAAVVNGTTGTSDSSIQYLYGCKCT